MTLTIAGVADIVPGTKYRPLPDSPFFEYTHSAALTVANLEVPLTDRPAPVHGGIVLHSPVIFAKELNKAGITVGSIANNHSASHGANGLLDTIAACEGVGVVTVGYGANREDASRPVLVDVKDDAGRQYRVAIVTATTVGPRDTFATSEPGISGLRVVTSRKDDPRATDNPGAVGIAVTEPVEEDLRMLEEQVRAAKTQTPVVVAVMHWGLGDAVLDYMRITAQRLIDAGACMVFGHHSHRLAAVDWYHGAPIYYGLGSFLFQYDGSTPVHVPRDAAVALVEIDPETGVAAKARLVIGRLDADGVPWPATPERVERVVEDVVRLSAGRSVEICVEPDGCLLEPR